MWLQHDGTPVHKARQPRTFLTTTFGKDITETEALVSGPAIKSAICASADSDCDKEAADMDCRARLSPLGALRQVLGPDIFELILI
ncbi:hypothetical protein AVEN_54594-1 [Araneus ventricosus]|uniref:Uncharacterized protein n=1 Tax=Araneus ventricosus TaxID=182803 RepID=A0A4Y2BL09_ARAVE|nr:hypothetical protein AVEN_54594-1 [Araneus ventricosus]